MKNIIRNLIFIAAVLFFASCSNLFNESSPSGNNENTNVSTTQKKYGSIQGHFNFEGAVSSAIFENETSKNGPRTAIASLPANYYVFATRTNNSQTIEGTVDSTNKTYTISGVEVGVEWRVEIGIKSSSDAKVMNAVSDAFALSETNLTVTRDFMLKPVTGGKGSVLLIMEVPSTITNLSAVGLTGLASSFSATGQDPTLITLSANDIAAGFYTVTFEFKNSSGIPLYKDTQIINVFSNCETNTWLSNGGTGPITGSNYVVTTDHLNTFARTTFYVGTTSYAEASTTGFGSFADPVTTLSRVGSIIAGRNNSSADYTIYVCGTVTGDQTLSNNLNGKATSITIRGLTPTTAGNAPADILQCSVNGNTNKSTLTLGTTVPVTIENLKITKGYKSGTLTAGSGGGLYITAGTVTLQNNVYVTENKASANGGGIYVSNATLKLGNDVVITENQAYDTAAAGGGVYVASGAKLFMYGRSLIGDMTETTAFYNDNNSTVYGNFARGKGGGIANNGGEVYIGYSGFGDSNNLITSTMAEGYGIRRNVTLSGAGGIFQYSTNTGILKIGSGSVSYNASTGSSSQGGAIYFEGGSITIGAATMAKNSAASGGAVCMGNSTRITIDGAAQITENEATNGGAIYCGGTVTVTGSASFRKNTATGNGGAVYIASPGTFDMQNGTIGSDSRDDNNIAGSESGSGGAVYVAAGDNSHLKMKAGAKIKFPEGSTVNQNDVYLSSSKTIEITDSLDQTTTKVAAITVPNLVRGTSVLSGGAYITDASVEKFSINAAEWTIEKYGSGTSAAGIINADIYVSASGSDSNTGTSTYPYKTIAAAAMNCKPCKTEINVVGTLTAESSTDLQSIPNNIYITVSSITLKGTGSGAIIDANGKGDAFTVNKALILTITNIMFKGAKNDTISSIAGIYIQNSSADVRLGNGVKVEGNYYGINNKGTLCLYGDVIVGKDENSIPNAETNAGNSNYGITSSKALWIGYTEPASDKEDTSTDTCKIKQNMKRGIYNNGTAHISNGEISYNADGGIDNQGTLTITGGNINFNKASRGGGINNGGTLTISGNATINNNEATSSGGGIYHGSTQLLTISGGEISSNTGTGISDGETSNHYIVMTGGKICKNSKKGVWLNTGANFIMSGSASIGDSSDSNSGNGEGGIHTGGGNFYLGYTYNNGTISAVNSMEGGIFYNTVTGTSGNGGAIFNNGKVYIAAGKIIGNTAGGNGGAIYHNGFTLNIKGNASLPCSGVKQNDIFLCEGSSALKSITVDGALEGTAPIATITPANYSSTSPVIQVSDGVNLAQSALCFDVNPNGSTTYSISTSTGKLQTSTVMTSSNIASFTPVANQSYNFVMDSTVIPADMKTFLEKLCNKEVNTSSIKIGASTLDLSKYNYTTIGKMIFGDSSDPKLVEQPITTVILPAKDFGDAMANYRVRECFSGVQEFIVPPGSTSMSSDNYGVVYNYDKTKIIYYPAASDNSSYTWPESVAEVGGFAFAFTKNLTTMNIPSSVTKIGTNAFEYAKITNLTIPSSVIAIDQCAFFGCDELVTATINNAFTSHMQFKWCTKLESITFTTNLTKIGTECFDGAGLKSVTIPNSVTEIGGWAFIRCNSMTTLTFENTSNWKAYVYTNNYTGSYDNTALDTSDLTVSNYLNELCNYTLKREN